MGNVVFVGVSEIFSNLPELIGGHNPRKLGRVGNLLDRSGYS